MSGIIAGLSGVAIGLGLLEVVMLLQTVEARIDVLNLFEDFGECKHTTSGS